VTKVKRRQSDGLKPEGAELLQISFLALIDNRMCLLLKMAGFSAVVP